MAPAKSTTIEGDISIHTENILPIIKKWLYSEKEIFVRELVSNAHDAITKLQKIVVKEGLDLDATGTVNIQIDKDKKTLTFSDTGLGMDAEEIQKYINQIAFSSAEDFAKKYAEKDEKSGVIGHFGLGFYSAFIIADKVEIVSKSYKKKAKAVRWECDGSTKFIIESATRDQIGTDIILHVGKEHKEFLSDDKLKDLVKRFANFLPIEIQVNGEKANEQNPLWTRQPKDVTDEEYKEFYQKLYPFSPEPLFWIHLNVDYPFNLQGILYFPKLLHELDSQKGRVKLFCQQVFVTDDAKEVIPEFLTLLQGAIDCPDIPLNVSRSYLQNDPYVQKISKHIVKKVADKLNALYKKDKASYEKYWEDINPFIKYGMMHHDDFYKKVKDIVIFKSTSGYATTIPEYLERNKDKTDQTVLYSTDKEAQATYIQLCKDQDLEVIYLSHVIDSHFVQFLESKDTETKYKSVDSDLSEILVDSEKDSKIVDADNQTQKEKIQKIFENTLKKDKLVVKVEPLKSEDISALMTQAEHFKRLKSMSAMMGQNMPDFEDFTLVVNSNNPLIKKIASLSDVLTDQSDKVRHLCEHVYDLALMGQRQLTGEQMQAFVKRSNQLLLELS